LGQVKRREGRLGSGLGLTSQLNNMLKSLGYRSVFIVQLEAEATRFGKTP